MINRDELKEQFEIWYGNDKYRTKSINEYVEFLKKLLDEILYCLAHVCRDIRILEGRQ